MVYKPNKNTIILDDDPYNTLDWEKNGGKSILYNSNVNHSTKKIVKKLPNLLK